MVCQQCSQTQRVQLRYLYPSLGVCTSALVSVSARVWIGICIRLLVSVPVLWCLYLHVFLLVSVVSLHASSGSLFAEQSADTHHKPAVFLRSSQQSHNMNTGRLALSLSLSLSNYIIYKNPPFISWEMQHD